MNMSRELLVLTILQAAVALIFLKGFLLTRVELPDVSHCQGAGCSSQPTAYSKAVLLIVDAVRYDFLCGQSIGNGLSPTSLMPKTLHWAHAGVSCVLKLAAQSMPWLCLQQSPHSMEPAIHSSCLMERADLLEAVVAAVQAGAVASRFVADTPTITMSRLKALLTVRAVHRLLDQHTMQPSRRAGQSVPPACTAAVMPFKVPKHSPLPNVAGLLCYVVGVKQGGLPTFLDVGQSFSASAISEDNILQQLLARKRRLVSSFGCGKAACALEAADCVMRQSFVSAYLANSVVSGNLPLDDAVRPEHVKACPAQAPTELYNAESRPSCKCHCPGTAGGCNHTPDFKVPLAGYSCECSCCWPPWCCPAGDDGR